MSVEEVGGSMHGRSVLRESEAELLEGVVAARLSPVARIGSTRRRVERFRAGDWETDRSLDEALDLGRREPKLTAKFLAGDPTATAGGDVLTSERVRRRAPDAEDLHHLGDCQEVAASARRDVPIGGSHTSRRTRQLRPCRKIP